MDTPRIGTRFEVDLFDARDTDLPDTRATFPVFGESVLFAGAVFAGAASCPFTVIAAPASG